MAFTPFGWKRKSESLLTPLNPPTLEAAEEALAAQVTSGAIPPPSSTVSSSAGVSNIPFTTIGLVNAQAAPYGAKLDGVTDDTAAFTALHEAINAGTVKGYYLIGSAKINGTLPAIINPGYRVQTGIGLRKSH